MDRLKSLKDGTPGRSRSTGAVRAAKKRRVVKKSNTKKHRKYRTTSMRWILRCDSQEYACQVSSLQSFILPSGRFWASSLLHALETWVEFLLFSVIIDPSEQNSYQFSSSSTPGLMAACVPSNRMIPSAASSTATISPTNIFRSITMCHGDVGPIYRYCPPGNNGVVLSARRWHLARTARTFR
ncbi:hypothetical protein GGR58DRAFT_122392 [Xylaria digitata]|nr:hypothetical protein GGR58DRAFT_122392 [Xylaria digitata]